MVPTGGCAIILLFNELSTTLLLVLQVAHSNAVKLAAWRRPVVGLIGLVILTVEANGDDDSTVKLLVIEKLGAAVKSQNLAKLAFESMV